MLQKGHNKLLHKMRPIYMRKVEGVNRIDRVRSYEMVESLRQEDVL